MSVSVRRARLEEHDLVGDLTLAAYGTLAGMELGDYADTLRDAGDRAVNAELLVAVDEDDRVVGGVTYVPGLGPYAEFSEADAAGIRMLAVRPDARDRGVGSALVRACVARARGDGRARIILHTTEWMAAAQRLYAREGFRRAPARDWLVEPGLLLLGYELELDEDAPA